jgi:hypothetical protein
VSEGVQFGVNEEEPEIELTPVQVRDIRARVRVEPA